MRSTLQLVTVHWTAKAINDTAYDIVVSRTARTHLTGAARYYTVLPRTAAILVRDDIIWPNAMQRFRLHRNLSSIAEARPLKLQHSVKTKKRTVQCLHLIWHETQRKHSPSTVFYKTYRTSRSFAICFEWQNVCVRRNDNCTCCKIIFNDVLCPVFAVQRNASALYAVVLCPSVRLSVRHKSKF